MTFSDGFFAAVAFFMLSMLVGFMLFVAYIYWDASTTLKNYASHYKPSVITYSNPDEDGWRDITFEKVS